MNAEQYEGIVGRLDAILGKMPAVPQLAPPVQPATMDRLLAQAVTPPAAEPASRARPVHVDTGGPLGPSGQRGAYRALKRLLDVLDGWIEGTRENHYAMDHDRYENAGQECWTQFHPRDIRSMVNEVARELGVTEPCSDVDSPTTS